MNQTLCIYSTLSIIVLRYNYQFQNTYYLITQINCNISMYSRPHYDMDQYNTKIGYNMVRPWTPIHRIDNTAFSME